MTHNDMHQNEVIERYVRGQLQPDERQAFEEHFFICDECFQQVQVNERFIAGVHYAARANTLAPGVGQSSITKPDSPWLTWLKPVLLITTTASLILALAVGWLLFYRMPAMRNELASERQSREETEHRNRQSLDDTQQDLDNERRERARLENELRQRPGGNSNNQPTLLAEAQPNVPLVMLEATRDGGSNELALPAGAKNVVLWLEVEPGARFDSFRLQIYSADNRLILTIDGLKKNAYGALAASVPASVFQSDKHLVKLFGMNQQQLLGEYKLQVRKR
jgi:putative zinc finger protein